MKDKKIVRLVGAGLPQRSGRSFDLPWASDEEIDAVIDLTKTLSPEEIAAHLNTNRDTVNA